MWTWLPKARLTQTRLLGISCALLLYMLVFIWRNWSAAPFIDFPSFWVAATLVVFEGSVPYGETFAVASAGLRQEYTHPFVYPPPSLLIYGPLSLLDLEAASRLHLFANIATTFVIAALVNGLVGTAGRASRLQAAVIFLFLLFAKHVNSVYFHGQVDLMVLLLTIGAVASVTSRPLLAGGLIALAILLKPYVTVLLGLLLLTARLLPLASALGVLAASVLLSVVVFGHGFWLAWTDQMFGGETFGSVFSVENVYNISLRGALTRLELPEWIGFSSLIFVGAATFAATWLRPRFSVEAAMCWLCLVVLMPTVSWYFYSVYALPPAVVACTIAWHQKRMMEATFTIIASVILFYNPFEVLFGDLGNVALTAAVLIVWAQLFVQAFVREPDPKDLLTPRPMPPT